MGPALAINIFIRRRIEVVSRIPRPNNLSFWVYFLNLSVTYPVPTAKYYQGIAIWQTVCIMGYLLIHVGPDDGALTIDFIYTLEGQHK